jgi:hypothetical protein
MLPRIEREAGASVADAAAGEGRLPDFYVVGHAKSGTTALYAMLRRHPQVYLGLKEPRYFVNELHERDIPRREETPKSLAQYKAWFAGARPEQTVGDISPDYLWSQFAADGIAAACPDARIIAILREPVGFLASLHRQLVQVYVESETDFGKALALEQPRREGRELPPNAYWPKALMYSNRIHYVEQLRRFERHFSREQMQVLIYDDYRRDNDATLRSVLRFIGVNDDHIAEVSRANESVEVRATGVNSLLRKLIVAEGAGWRAVKRSLTTLTPMRMRQRTLHATRKRLVYAEPTPPSEALTAELRARFKPEVVALSEYLDRDLVTLWGYDRLN